MTDEFEQTLVLIKPDALRNSLTGYVLSYLSEYHTGLHFAGNKVVRVTAMLAAEHYAEHRGKIFYPPLLDYICGNLHYRDRSHMQRVIAIVYQGENAVAKVRELAGPTNPHQARESRPGCIRSLGTVVPLLDENSNEIGSRMDNLIHASANPADAEREVKLWFRPNDIPPPMHAYPVSLSDDHFYYHEGELFTEYARGRICLFAPGDSVWTSDIEALHAISGGKAAHCSLETVAAKYLVNEYRDEVQAD